MLSPILDNGIKREPGLMMMTMKLGQCQCVTRHASVTCNLYNKTVNNCFVIKLTNIPFN